MVIGLLTSYLLGNLNGAVCISALQHDDVRSHGSGNAGSTNVLRVAGKKAAAITFICDFFKNLPAILEVKQKITETKSNMAYFIIRPLYI